MVMNLCGVKHGMLRFIIHVLRIISCCGNVMLIIFRCKFLKLKLCMF